MTTQEQAPNSPWISSPTIDLIFFSFGWVAVFLAFIWVDQAAFRATGRWVLLSLVLLVTVFHRHLTFSLVYGDRDVFETRRRSFTWLPIFFLLITLISLFYVQRPEFTTLALKTPVEFSKTDFFYIYLTEPKRTTSVKVPFGGTETTVPAVAQTVQRAVQGKLLVQATENRLEFTLPAGSNLKGFSFGSFRGPKLRERLGVPKISRLGWRDTQPLFYFLIILSSLWNFYHTLMQKQGILRVYSRKAGYGKSWLDRTMVWLWFGWLFFALAASPFVRNQASRLATSGKFLTNTLEPFFAWLPLVARGFMGVALAFTVLYILEEWRNRHRLHWPKNLYLLSLWGIYLTFFYDFLVGFLVFAFSHAIEYLAFVNIFAKKKYRVRQLNSSLMARWVHHQSLYFILFMVISGVIFIPWYFNGRTSLNWYIVGTSFLHFLYDGWIWKVRRPEVGSPLGISYPQPLSADTQTQIA